MQKEKPSRVGAGGSFWQIKNAPAWIGWRTLFLDDLLSGTKFVIRTFCTMTPAAFVALAAVVYEAKPLIASETFCNAAGATRLFFKTRPGTYLFKRAHFIRTSHPFIKLYHLKYK